MGADGEELSADKIVVCHDAQTASSRPANEVCHFQEAFSVFVDVTDDAGSDINSFALNFRIEQLTVFDQKIFISQTFISCFFFK